MFLASIGILAALAFVLGLGALALWAVKRFGTFGMSSRTRIPVEVVQRISLGPKTGLAVVRVGEKVVALSVGDGGVRPLFELDEQDRQSVIASSHVPVPMESSPLAAASFAKLLRMPSAPQIELEPVVAQAQKEDAFFSILRMSLKPSTRLTSLLLAAVLSAATALPMSAQGTGQPPVTSATQARVGNGASVTPATPNGARPTTDMRAPAATEQPASNARAASATPAPVAGGDQALAGMVPQMDIKLGNGEDGGLRLTGTVGIVVMMGLLTLLPTLLLMMTGFTRILIVLHFLKQAMGTQGAPPAHLLAALALLLTGFVMAPTLTEVNRDAITPWMDGKITQVEMMKTGVQPFREFMLKQTRPSDLKTFVEMSSMEQPNTPEDVPLHVLMSAFVASELRTAFQIGFAIYLPFIVIDAVVASVLMSMGMFMLPPAMISLPFKLLLFVLVDGWNLVITSLVQSFR